MCSTVEFWIWQQLSEKAACDISPMLLIFLNRKTQAAATGPPQLAASTGPFPHGETVSKGWILNPAIDWGPSKGSQELSTHSPTHHPFRNMKPPAVTVWSACQAETWATGASALCWCWLEEPKERQQSAVGFKRPSVIEGARENPLAGTGGGVKFQTNNGTKHRGRQTAEWLSGSSRNPILFLSNASFCHCPVCFDFPLWLTNACLQAEKSRQTGEKITAAPWLHIIWLHCRSLSFKVVILQSKQCLNIWWGVKISLW